MQSYQVTVPLLAEADDEARRLGHSFVAPEHLLIAVAANDAGRSRGFLDRAGLHAQTIRAAVEDLVGAERPPMLAATPLTLALRAQLAIADAIRIAMMRGEPNAPFRADDLLTALFGDEIAVNGVVGGILARWGLTPRLAREQFAAFAVTAT